MTKTTIAGTITMQNEINGDVQTRNVRPFEATTEWAWTDVVDEATMRTFDTGLWIPMDERITETEH